MKLRTLLLGASALFIAIAAAFFSVTGLSKLFAGASTAVILMASSLEFGKLISASFLYAYWDKINRALRTYLVIGVGVLILITSAGIYGFLTSAYQVTADQLGVLDKQVELVDLKKARFQEQLDGYNSEKVQLSQTISELSKGLSNNILTYTDSKGNVVTTTSSATRRALELQLNDSKSQRDVVSKKIEILSDSITKLDLSVLDIQQSSDVAAEVGPLKYMAEITGKPMATVVNWFALLIIFVFDPLAVTLVIAFNTALKVDEEEKLLKKVEENKEKKNFDLYNDELSDESTINENIVETNDNQDIDIPTEDDFKDWDFTLTDGLEDEDLNEEEVENFNEQFQKVESEEEKINELTNLKQDFSRRGVDVDGDGTVDGYDTNGDGMIDEMLPSTSSRWRYVVNKKPYYARADFDWSDRTKWINDQNAVNYWFTHIKKDSKYPDNFDSKTY
jgi:hypothetical protein